MKAVVMTAPGGPEVLQLTNVDDPRAPRENQLLIQLRAAGVNPIDTKLRMRGHFGPANTPAVLGCDGAGVVEAVGPRVTRFRVGDRVYFCQGGLGLGGGNYADYAVVDADCVATIPESVECESAAVAPLVLITAWEALHDRARIQSGQKVLIHGGAGGVGHVAIQIAKAVGAEVATTVSDAAKAKFVTELGADKVINYNRQDVLREIMEWTDGRGVDIAFDTIGGATFSASFPMVRHYGDLVTILEPDVSTPWKIARNRNLRISFELMLTPQLENQRDALAHQGHILKECSALMASGALKVQVNKTYPLAQASEAHRQLERGGMIGKIALKI
ncbi:MAG: zinc-dependent alcohol dehydrogenase family protein [Gammaproteobacteria bacterium]|nr:zinc-dependent alcohol dehydrogenase family protein [Gammaproteobacteria bacterium]MCP5135932.1 zinc-dependent alcohol dehydrogenase family protein [Gammaproteobacteria bacterium]